LSITENETAVKILKIAGIVLLSLGGIYFLGHVFKITAHTVRGFNDLKTSLNGK